MKLKIFIVIAAYNEEKKISQVISNLKKGGYNNIVVVDDGSTDKTFEVISKQNVYCLQHTINRGQGASLQTGIDFALSKNADLIVTFDADGQHRVLDIKSLVNCINKYGVDVALGSRFLNKDSNTPFIRKLLLKLGTVIVWVLYGVKLTDSHNGFRVLTRLAANKIRITSDRMEHASQIIEEIRKNNLSYKEVPVKITYTDYSKAKGQSSWNSIKIGLKMVFRKFVN